MPPCGAGMHSKAYQGIIQKCVVIRRYVSALAPLALPTALSKGEQGIGYKGRIGMSGLYRGGGGRGPLCGFILKEEAMAKHAQGTIWSLAYVFREKGTRRNA